MRWDDIEILRAVDRRQAEFGGELWSVNGMQLMNDMAGEFVAEDQRHRRFVREILNLRDAGYLTFRVDAMAGMATPTPESNPHYWLQQVRYFALTTAGQDRARGRIVFQAVPDPSEDDGRPFSRLILKQVAAVIQEEYGPDQIFEFLCESGVSRERIPGGLSGLTYEQLLGTADPSAYTLWSARSIDAYFFLGGVLYATTAWFAKRQRPIAEIPTAAL